MGALELVREVGDDNRTVRRIVEVDEEERKQIEAGIFF